MKKLFLLLFILSCQVKEPAQDSKILSASSPEAQGIASGAILSFIEAAETQQPNDLHSLIVVRHGKIVAEGWWNPYNPETPHLLYSLSKSFTSSAIGMAVSEGLLSLDDPVVSFYPDKIPENPSDNLKAIRIRDLLRMTTGHASDTYGRIRSHPDGWAAGFLSLPVEHKPGTIFIYNTGATYMLAAILQKVTGQTLVDFLQPRLFDPLEIKRPYWEKDPEGIEVGGTGLYVTTLDIAKFGQMYLQKGNWNGQQILPESWIEMATSLQTANGSSPESDWDQGYGFQFWMSRHGLYRGDGAFGQYCIVMPEQNAVIAITSGSSDMQGIMNMVWDHLLPAMSSEPLPEDEIAFAELKDKLKSLALDPIQGNPTSDMAAEVSGKKFIIQGANAEFSAVSFDLVNDIKNITLWVNEEAQEIPVGYGEMQHGEMMIPGWGKVPVASSGAWTGANTYRAMIYHVSAPHAIIFNFTFSGNEVTIDSEYNVSFGSTKRPQVKGKV
jgi:CubicO group peptidase (beta-lactamase class C family)